MLKRGEGFVLRAVFTDFSDFADARDFTDHGPQMRTGHVEKSGTPNPCASASLWFVINEVTRMSEGRAHLNPARLKRTAAILLRGAIAQDRQRPRPCIGMA
jgi:hypothetical protein